MEDDFGKTKKDNIDTSKFITRFKSIFEKHFIYLSLIFAFLLRFKGMDFGLPYLYDADEPAFMNPPIRMLVTGDLNPHWFGHPGSFVMYLLLILLSIFFIFAFLFGYVNNLSEFQQLFMNEPTVFYFSGRLLMVLFAIITIYLVYLIANRLFNNMVGILASFLLAISPLHIIWSRAIRTDIAATMLIMFSIYFLLRFLDSENKNNKFLIVSSLFAGFSIATKYTVGIIIFPILIHCLIIDSKQKYLFIHEKRIKYSLAGLGILLILIGIFVDFSWLKAIVDSYAPQCMRCKIIISNSLLLLAAAGILLITVAFYLINIFNYKTYISKAIIFIFIGFFIFAPFVLLDPITAIQNIIYENRGEHLSAERLPGIQNHIWYLTDALQSGIGGLFFEIFAGLGLILIFFKKSYKKYLFAVFPILFFLAIGSMRLRWTRWAIPILPFEAILFGYGFYCIYSNITQRIVFRKNNTKIFALPLNKIIFSLFAVIVVLASLNPIINDINYGTKLSKIDTRTIAKEWVETNLPNGSKIAYEWYTPPLHVKPQNNFTLLYLNWSKIVYKPLSFYKNQSVDYIIISSDYKQRYHNEPDKYPIEISRYEELEKEAELIKIFEPGDNPGTASEIYRLKYTN
ncbi:MAG: glycosyltransferase family 39 protein [Candidatus Methanoperedens sp.]|nr:glycosyltransferase family 39 protein [Candidatus Methanoperedens sp.]